MAVSLPRKLFTTAEYERLMERGVFNEEVHVELIRGGIVEMTPIGFRHVGVIINLEGLFGSLVGSGNVAVSTQNALWLPNNSVPQPDMALLKVPRTRYVRQRPTAGDVLLLIEVSDSTLAYDRGVKMSLYAEAGIAKAWIVNLVQDVIEAYSQPSLGSYTQTQTYGRGMPVSLPAELEGAVSVDEVLGQA